MTSLASNFKADRRVRIWRRRSECYFQWCVRELVGFSDVNVKVRGAFIANAKTSLVVIQRNMTAMTYRASRVLNPVLIPLYIQTIWAWSHISTIPKTLQIG